MREGAGSGVTAGARGTGRGTRATAFSALSLVREKRDGLEHGPEEIRALVAAFTRGEVPDYQMSAWTMAVLLRGMTPRETVALTLAMRDSGDVFRRGSFGGPAVDKHSTGGVGDKVSLALAPMAAAAGLRVPMVCGRGLGHTGGTTDKLEAIPGFRAALEPRAFEAQVREMGLAIIGPSAAIAPADAALYALRDVSGTVESIPLITASILSKKLAEGIDGLVLDVKVGAGAFMKTEEDARALAQSLVKVGRGAGLSVAALLTAMDAPLGLAIGNALETAEAFEVLLGRGPDDVRAVTLALGAEMLHLGGLERSRIAGRKRLERTLTDGSALRTMERCVAAQGGDPRVVTEPDRLPRAPHRLEVKAKGEGVVVSADALALGLASVALGAGRARKEDSIDPTVGLVVRARPGDRVRPGTVLAEVHARSEAEARAAGASVEDAIRIGRRAPPRRPLVLGEIRR